jgi:outer membrane protein assembly factor BamB/predicted MPP superfamily phosphohydrolase
MPMKIFWRACFLILTFVKVDAQSTAWKFAHVSDIHIGGGTSVEDLNSTIADINADTELQFVILSGDITEFGSDDELTLAKTLLNGLNKPWYIVPGNHDMNWSESGGNSFKTVFGSETFAFNHNGFLFLGTNCGPNMRMSPGQVPQENLVWLDSVLKATPKTTPIIFVNHYPIDSALNNWYEVINRLKTRNTQLIICGHGHSNHKQNFEGIPGVMGRSNLRAKDTIGGYNIVTIAGDSVSYNERTPGVKTNPTWIKERLYTHDFKQGDLYPRPNLTINKRFNTVKTVWSKQDVTDIGAGSAIAGDRVIVSNTAGWVKAYRLKNGKQLWSTKTGGKIYSTPCVDGNNVLVASTDKYLYSLDKSTGKVNWKIMADKPIVASPVINNGSVFCGGSDGHFRCYDLTSGNLKWDFADVKGFVVTRPVVKNGKIYFGGWGNYFYALDEKTGALVWSWTNGSANRMFSPASCVPVITGNRVFIVAPDRYMTCLNATTGAVIWRKGDPRIRIREAMGVSADTTLIYGKTMEGDILGFSAKADSMEVKWKAKRNIGYDISPSLIEEHEGLVFTLSNSGNIYAFKREDGELAWVHKLSNCLVNPLSFFNGNQLIGTTMDGKIACLRY